MRDPGWGARAGLGGTMPTLSLRTLRILACPPERRDEALRLLYQHASAPVRAQLMAEALADADAGRVDLSGLWLALRNDRPIGALLTQTLAGRAAAVWAPQIHASWGRRVAAEALVRAALEGLQRRGIRVAQALLDPSTSREAAADLTRGGLPRVTGLLYQGRDTRPLEPPPGRTRPVLDWIPYGPDTDADFRAVLERTYEGSLDMPELEGVRSLDDVLASQRAGGRFAPGRWQLGRVPGEPGAAALVLLSDQPERSVWEVTYLGLTPEARGRGLGQAALAHAFDLARPHTDRLELAVDTRNTPAVTLYRRAGFAAFDCRAVHLRILPPPAASLGAVPGDRRD